MLHLIPDDDGQPHAPTTECGCDPQLDRWRGQVVLMHVPAGAERRDGALPGSFKFSDGAYSYIRLREVMGHE